jgi:peroxiredoxin family protein
MKKRKRILKPLNDKIKFIPCSDAMQIYSYTRTDVQSRIRLIK